jgi:hypothetical protein
MPAPVTTTIFLALRTVEAIDCSSESLSGRTCTVGMFDAQRQSSRSRILAALLQHRIQLAMRMVTDMKAGATKFTRKDATARMEGRRRF